jgi:hypothetical protein
VPGRWKSAQTGEGANTESTADAASAAQQTELARTLIVNGFLVRLQDE